MEALSVGDRVAVLVDGKLEQVGAPEDVWLHPATVRVARLMGDPPINLLSGSLQSEGDATFFLYREHRIPLMPELARAASRASSGSVTLGVRPDGLALDPGDGAGGLPAEIYSVEPFGKHAIITVDPGGQLLKMKTSMPDALRHGERIGKAAAVRVSPRGMLLFDGATGAALSGG
jgi:multiple sugar transport system ATP-binding protein